MSWLKYVYPPLWQPTSLQQRHWSAHGRTSLGRDSRGRARARVQTCFDSVVLRTTLSVELSVVREWKVNNWSILMRLQAGSLSKKETLSPLTQTLKVFSPGALTHLFFSQEEYYSGWCNSWVACYSQDIKLRGVGLAVQIQFSKHFSDSVLT